MTSAILPCVSNHAEVEDSLFVVLTTVLVTGAAAWIMVHMDASSRSQGGRFFVAVGALVVLGLLDRLSGGSRDGALLSLLMMVLAAFLLIALALNLP